MKIALVNTAEFSDIAEAPEWPGMKQWLQKHNIDYVDYASGRATVGELLAGLGRAVGDPKIDLIWLVGGGNKCIQLLNTPAISQLKGAKLMGTSDFTHLAWRALEQGAECYYGQCLRDVVRLEAEGHSQAYVSEFLKTGELPDHKAAALTSDEPLRLQSASIVGGHLIINGVMLPSSKIDLSDRVLFIEHHYLPGETCEDLGYWIEALKLRLSGNMPRGFMLGKSHLTGADNQKVQNKKILNTYIKHLQVLRLPIYYMDHEYAIIPFKNGKG
jgi:muramoyltetrapeptide carboxypeptidase LdcA involved in peptidoglycan recycling